MIFFRSLLQIMCISWPLLFLSGCISIDSHISSEKIDSSATSILKGTFENKSYYQSKSLDVYSSKITLAELLGIDDAKDAPDVQIYLEKGKILHFQFIHGDKVLREKEYFLGTGFKIGSDGKIIIEQNYGCGADPNTGVGCEGRSVILFLNAKGNLVCNISQGGAGLAFLVIPIGGYTKEMTIHRKSDY